MLLCGMKLYPLEHRAGHSGTWRGSIMKLPYLVGWPGWKFLARRGVPILIPLKALHDKEAGVLVFASDRLRGLVVEVPENAPVEDVHREVNQAVSMLLEELLHEQPKAQPITAWPGDFAPA